MFCFVFTGFSSPLRRQRSARRFHVETHIPKYERHLKWATVPWEKCFAITARVTRRDEVLDCMVRHPIDEYGHYKITRIRPFNSDVLKNILNDRDMILVFSSWEICYVLAKLDCFLDEQVLVTQYAGTRHTQTAKEQMDDIRHNLMTERNTYYYIYYYVTLINEHESIKLYKSPYDKDEDVEESTDVREEENDSTDLIDWCPICYGEMTPCTELDVCKHRFCTTCITLWLAGHNTCPLCRTKLPRQTLLY